jgi:hypothetical protein
MQPNRAAREAMKDGGVISDDNLGDSYGQLRPLDGLYTINQTDNEKKAGVARIYIAKARNGKSRWTFFVSVCPNTLRFESISENRYRVAMSQVISEAADNVAIDELKVEEVIKRPRGAYKPSDYFHDEDRG